MTEAPHKQNKQTWVIKKYLKHLILLSEMIIDDLFSPTQSPLSDWLHLTTAGVLVQGPDVWRHSQS